jgi:hypothetical protein
MMNNNEAALRNAAGLYPLDNFSQALTDLRYKRQSILNCRAPVVTVTHPLVSGKFLQSPN